VEIEKTTRETGQQLADRRTQFNSAWFFMVVLLVGIGLLTGQRTPFVVAACLLTVIPAAWWWKGLALRRIEYERRFDRRCAFPGEKISMHVRITNRKILPITWLEIKDEIPMSLPLVKGALMPTHVPQVGTLETALALRWYERVVHHHHLLATARGIFPLGPVHLRSGDLFTLFEARQTIKQRDRLVVYPHIWPLAELGMPANEPFGERKTRQRPLADPLRTIGIRAYHPEDSLRFVHWKATAHRGDLQVRVFEPAAAPDLVLLLNVSTFEHHWQGFIPELFERTINVAASLATWAVGQKYKVGLAANGCLPLSDQPIRVPPSRAPGQLAAVLEALAGVTSFASLSIQELLRRESPRLPWGATLVVVTAIVPEDLAIAILRLRDAGRRMALVSLAEEAPPILESVSTHHLPSATPAFEQLARGEYDPLLALRAAGLTAETHGLHEVHGG
jgi:uncharacterized protein (DUF58 family)